MSEGYSVVYSGELLEGFEPERARAGLMKVFQIDEAQAEGIVSGGERVIKRGLTEEKAERYREVMGRIGMVVSTLAPEAEMIPPEGETVVLSAPPLSEGSAAPADTGPAEAPFHFSGKAGEYFRIWIVNVLLTIATLGIYSAWAKVRNNRYFYGNTQVAGSTFEYLAEPLAILKGRIIAVVLFVVYAFASNTQSLLSLAALLLMMAVLPWLIARSLAFRNRNTALRNIRFGFDGGYMGALKAFILWPVAGAFTFGLLMPVAICEQDRYVVGNSRFGTTPFEFDEGAKAYYKLFGGVLVVLIGGFAGIFLLSMLLGFGMSAVGLGGEPGSAPPTELGGAALAAGLVAAMVPALSILLVYLLAFAYFAAKRHNLIYNGARFADHGFSASMAPVRLAWIQVSNWVVTLITLGLARPWAKIRLAHYKAQCLTLVTAGALDAFVAAEQENVNAMGEELGEAFDFDIGL